ncbi:MAG: hypothetical protein EOO47_00680 [Flavobacterium sp.]|nr:MAG: hypothetical protein EOO47_00680 [Flavobacterium sp.]
MEKVKKANPAFGLGPLGKMGFHGLNSQDVADALRNAITVVIPFALFFFLGYPAAALGIGTGAILICLTDLPGNRSEKLFGAWTSLIILFLVSTLTVWTIKSFYLLPFLVASLTFLLLMLVSLGQRMGAIAMMGLVLMAFTIGLQPAHPLEYGIYIMIGGLWYYIVSLAQVWIFPYHALKRALAKTRRDTGSMMRLRATGYNKDASLSGFNARNIKLHLKLTSDHELVRRLLLGDKMTTKFKDQTAKHLLRQSIILIDLYEQVSALHHDYHSIRKVLQKTGLLELIEKTINLTADKLEGVSCDRVELDRLIFKIEQLSTVNSTESALVNSIVINLKETSGLIFALDDEGDLSESVLAKEFSGFLTEGKFSFKKLLPHFSYQSQVFKFALRMAVLMFVVVFSITLLPKGSFGYWLPITIIVVSRPSYGMTMKRNIERLSGTVAGLILAWVLVEVGLATSLQLIMAVICLFVFYAFLFVRYWISALGITIAVVLCLSVYQGNPAHILSERLLFTVIGCILGLGATFLFPVNHISNLKSILQRAIGANRAYLLAVLAGGDGEFVERIKLARKESYLSLAALNEAISVASKEPKWRRKELKALRQLELLCFQLNALTAALPSINDAHQHTTSAITDELDRAFDSIKNMPYQNLFNIQPLKRLDGPLNLANVSYKLRSVLSSDF